MVHKGLHGTGRRHLAHHTAHMALAGRSKLHAPPFWTAGMHAPRFSPQDMLKTLPARVYSTLVAKVSVEIPPSGDVVYDFQTVPSNDDITAGVTYAQNIINKWKDAWVIDKVTSSDMRSNVIEIQRRQRSGIPVDVEVHARSALNDTWGPTADVFMCALTALNIRTPHITLHGDGTHDPRTLGRNATFVHSFFNSAMEMHFSKYIAATMCLLNQLKEMVAATMEPPFAKQFLNDTNRHKSISETMMASIRSGKVDVRINDRVMTIGLITDWHARCNTIVQSYMDKYKTIVDRARSEAATAVMHALRDTAPHAVPPEDVAGPADTPPPPPPPTFTEPPPGVAREWERCAQRVTYDAVLVAYGRRNVAYDYDALTAEFCALATLTGPHPPMRGFERHVDALASQLRQLRRK